MMSAECQQIVLAKLAELVQGRIVRNTGY